MGAVNDSNEIFFSGAINQNSRYEFSNHLTLIKYLRDELLPICDSSRRYKLQIGFDSDKNEGTKVISSVLEMPQIVGCSNVEIGIFRIDSPVQMPIEKIEEWLNQKTGRIGFSGKKEEKFLKIYSYNIENVLEMCEHLTEVLNNFKC